MTTCDWPKWKFQLDSSFRLCAPHLILRRCEPGTCSRTEGEGLRLDSRLAPPLLLSYLSPHHTQRSVSCCVTGSQYSGASFHCSGVTSRMKGHVEGRGKNSCWGHWSRSFDKSLGHVFPDLNNQESSGALQQVEPPFVFHSHLHCKKPHFKTTAALRQPANGTGYF